MIVKDKKGSVARKLITLSEPGKLWCGVEVEAYWIARSPRERNKPQRIYVRAHATRLTMLREQKNAGRSVFDEDEARKWVTRYLRVFKRWERARRTRRLIELNEPWTQEELARLVQRRSEPTTASLRIHLENQGDYELAERLMVRGEPDWRTL